MHTLFTFGYQSSKPEYLLRYVRGIQAVLVDIRYSPRSKMPEWGQQSLVQLVGEAFYQPLRDLGNLNFASTGAINLANPDRGTALLAELLEQRPAIILCACWSWEACHRKTVADLMARQYGARVEHLPANPEKWKYVHRLPALTTGGAIEQLSLF